MQPKLRVTASAAACLLIAACGGHKAPTGQVVATVDGKEITSTDLRTELGSFKAPNPETRRAAEAAALDAIVTRKVLAEGARKAGVAKSPEFAQRELKLEETLLVQAWQESIAKQVPPPTRDEAVRYVAENPNTYANHKLFDVDQVQMGRPNDSSIVKELEPLHSLDEVVAVLKKRGVPYRQLPATLDSLVLDPRVVDQLLKMPQGEPFVMPAGQIMTINHTTAVREQPITGEPAITHATRRLQQMRTQEAVSRQLQGVLAAAKKDVLYNKAYEPKAPAAAPTGKAK